MGGGKGPYCEVNLELMDETTSLNSLGGFVFVLLLFAAVTGSMNFSAIQHAALGRRLAYVSHLNVCFCLISIFCYIVHVVGALMHMDHTLLNRMSYLEYLLTCPLMMISFCILGGPRVQHGHRAQAFSLTVLVILFGSVATLLESRLVGLVCFLFGAAMFTSLIFVLNMAVMEHSQGSEGLFKGKAGEHFSPYKKLGRKLFFTWILFPVWWLCSSDGMGLLTDSEVANSCVKLILNILAKGMYILFIRLLQDKFHGKESLMDHHDPKHEDGANHAIGTMEKGDMHTYPPPTNGNGHYPTYNGNGNGYCNGNGYPPANGHANLAGTMQYSPGTQHGSDMISECSDINHKPPLPAHFNRDSLNTLDISTSPRPLPIAPPAQTYHPYQEEPRGMPPQGQRASPPETGRRRSRLLDFGAAAML